MTDEQALRGRLAALVAEWRKSDEQMQCANLEDTCCHGTCATELEDALKACTLEFGQGSDKGARQIQSVVGLGHEAAAVVGVGSSPTASSTLVAAKQINGVLSGGVPDQPGVTHVGWIAGHCSDPLNCPVCKAEGDKPQSLPTYNDLRFL